MALEDQQHVDRAAGNQRPEPRVVIVADTASAKFGGEAILPLQYFRLLRSRGVEAWLIVHDRTTQELKEALGDEMSRVHLLHDKLIEMAWAKIAKWTGSVSTELLLRSFTQWRMRGLVRRLVAEVRANVVHQPTPVSPRSPSFIFDVGAPVVIGPMNGGMSYPPGFQTGTGRVKQALLGVSRKLSELTHAIAPGKRRAAALLVANKRTRDCLPPGITARVIELVENGVDLSVFRFAERDRAATSVPRFAFVGRLIGWKAVDLLLFAVQKALRQTRFELLVIGDGGERAALERLSHDLGLDASVRFTGYLTQRDCAIELERVDALVLPSLFECGGAVVLEAMAKGLPVIATNWGGPADYLDETTGILVEPENRERFIEGLTAALVRMANSPDLRRAMGAAGRARVEDVYDWQRKIDRMVEIYREVQPARA